MLTSRSLLIGLRAPLAKDCSSLLLQICHTRTVLSCALTPSGPTSTSRCSGRKVLRGLNSRSLDEVDWSGGSKSRPWSEVGRVSEGVDLREVGRGGEPREDRDTTSSSKIPTCENLGATPPGIESYSPGSEASSLTTELPRHLGNKMSPIVYSASCLISRSLQCVGQRLGRSPPNTLIRARYPAGSLPDFRMWESCWTMPLAGGFYWSTPISPALEFQRRSILGSHFMSCIGDGYEPVARAAVDVTDSAVQSCQRELGSIPGVGTAGISHVVIVPGDAAARRIFSEISCFPRPFISAMLHSHLISPTSALKTSSFRAAQISQLNSTQLTHFLRAAMAERLDCSHFAKANKVQSPAVSTPDFRKWGSCRTMPLVSEFSSGSHVFSTLALRHCSILTLFHSHRL
ncbi:hypothetical protein PR048_007262 [Dryococelus australis]|uniref:Uncharacterized protein n=1 Tax=Dryococelus australis TaxID=614101 RepID=A0ABQ9ID62_9NEOP|nr:hypothetical protein PR048_007262 [Dryococelus australis]